MKLDEMSREELLKVCKMHYRKLINPIPNKPIFNVGEYYNYKILYHDNSKIEFYNSNTPVGEYYRPVDYFVEFWNEKEVKQYFE